MMLILRDIKMLILICGPTRAGKTTYSKKFESQYKIFHLDYLGSSLSARYQQMNKIVSKITDDIVIEGLYLTADVRENLLKFYKGNHTKCIYINTPLEIRRNRPAYQSFCEFNFELPTYREGWDEIEIIGV